MTQKEELRTLPLFDMETNLIRTTLSSRSKAFADPYKKGGDDYFLNQKATLFQLQQILAKRIFREARCCSSFEQLKELEDVSRIHPDLRRAMIRIMEQGDTAPSRFLCGISDSTAEGNHYTLFINPIPFLFAFNQLDVKPTMDSHFAQSILQSPLSNL
jgi:hypothetical protein